MSATPVSYRHAPPTLGQHTNEILAEMLGMDEEECRELAQKGVV
jgi:crotonobetainyl-CoA:carnitine CoA-transferase CaiB-like acyl-CoA transferase